VVQVSDLSPRDEIVATILNLAEDDGLFIDTEDASHIADRLLAAGWVKTPEPAWEYLDQGHRVIRRRVFLEAGDWEVAPDGE
jgi:hypothetical protein